MREPMILAAESPIPMDSTPLNKISLFADFTSDVIHNGRNVPINRYIFVRTRLPWSLSSVNFANATSISFEIGRISKAHIYST